MVEGLGEFLVLPWILGGVKSAQQTVSGSTCVLGPRICTLLPVVSLRKDCCHRDDSTKPLSQQLEQ